MQEAFLHAFCALPGFRPHAPFRPWLFAIVTHQARRSSRHAHRKVSWDALPEQPDPAATRTLGAVEVDLCQ